MTFAYLHMRRFKGSLKIEALLETLKDFVEIADQAIHLVSLQLQ